MNETKPTNPKDIIGSNKLPLHLWPQTATAYGCLALLDGALKYGRGNYRAIGVRASIYYDACLRHLTAWFEGQDQDPDSGLPHLAHALACLAILVDAQVCGKLNDDRQYPGGWANTVEILTPHVARLKELRQEHNPMHYTKQTPRLIHRKKAWGGSEYVFEPPLPRHQLQDDMSHEDEEGDPNYWGV